MQKFIKKIKKNLLALPFIGKWLLSWVPAYLDAFKISPLLSLVQLASPNWNYVINVFASTRLNHLLSSNPILCYELLQKSILLRRYADASRFYFILSSINDELLTKVQLNLSYTQLVISEIEKLSGKNICNSEIDATQADFLEEEISSKSFQDLCHLLSEHSRLDCLFTEQFHEIVRAHQSIELSSLGDDGHRIVYLDSSWFDSIGHFYYFDSLIKGIILNLIPIDFIYFNPDSSSSLVISNSSLYFRYINLAKSYGLCWTGSLESKPPCLYMYQWPDNYGNLIDNTTFASRIQRSWFSSGRKSFQLMSVLEVSSYESDLSKHIEIKNGGKKLITFHVRQSSFKRESRFSISDARNSNPDLLFQVLSELAENELSDYSLHFVMLGDIGMKSVPQKYQKHIFDYPHSSLKSEEFDVFLIQYTTAHIGTLSGISHLPCVLEKPTLVLNTCPLVPAITTGTMYVPKLYRRFGQYLSFREFHQIRPPVYWGGKSSLKNLSIDLVDTSYEDMKSSVLAFIKAVFHESPSEVVNKSSVSVKFSDFPGFGTYNTFPVPIEKSFYDKYSYLF